MTGEMKLRLPIKDLRRTVVRAREFGMSLEFSLVKRCRWEFRDLDPGYEFRPLEDFPSGDFMSNEIVEVRISGDFSAIASLLS